MPSWWRTPSWRRSMRPFRCWTRWRAARPEAGSWNVRSGAQKPASAPKDSFDEIDFGSYFQDYLDPGYRTQPEYEENEKPSFENFLSQPTTLSDHLAWQLGPDMEPALRLAAEFVIGNLDEDGYLPLTRKTWPRRWSSTICCRDSRRRRTRMTPRQRAGAACDRTGADISTQLAWVRATCASAC